MRVVLGVLILAGLLNCNAFAAPTACTLISNAEMSTILGAAVVGVSDDRGDRPSARIRPLVRRSAEPMPRCN